MKEKESYIEKQKDIFGDTTWFTYRYEVNGMVYETSAGSLDICRKAREWPFIRNLHFRIAFLCPSKIISIGTEQ